MSNAPKKNEVLILYGIPPIQLSTVEKGGVPLSASLKNLIGADAQVHITYPALGAITLATYLRNNGINTFVQDRYVDKIDVSDYGIIGISATHIDKNQLKEIAEMIRLKNPTTVIVAGGPTTTTYSPDELFISIPQLDYIVIGEGEKTFLELIKSIQQRLPVNKLTGIAYREGGCVKTTEKIAPLHPDAIVTPDWSLIDTSKRLPLLSIESGRGCLYDCAYCFEVSLWGKPVRYRNPQTIVNEIHQNNEMFGITNYRFADSCFTAPEKRCIEICDLIITNFTGQGIPVRWSCYARINNLSRSLLKKMHAAGCVAVCVGMESGDSHILKDMNKSYTPDQIIAGISAAREAGIITHCNVIAGFPGENIDSIQKTIDILNQSKPNTFHCMQLDIAPNTFLSKNKEQYQITGDRLEWKHKTMSSGQTIYAMKNIMEQVNESCHLPMGDIVSMLFIAAGYTITDITLLFQSLSNGTAGQKEIQMIQNAGIISASEN